MSQYIEYLMQHIWGMFSPWMTPIFFQKQSIEDRHYQ